MTKLNFSKSRIPKKRYLGNIPKKLKLTWKDREEIKLWKTNRKLYKQKQLDKKRENDSIKTSPMVVTTPEG